MSSDDAKLFVAGLPDSVSEDVLKQLFEATGGQVVSVSIPKDRTTGRPRGFGFVTMGTGDEAKAARGSLDGSLQAGRSISVRPFQAESARSEAPRDGGFRPTPRGDGPPRGAPMPQDRTLYVGNLPYDAAQDEIETLVNSVTDNAVVRVNLPMDPDGRKRGFGFVTLASSEAAKIAADALANADLRGRRLIVNIAHPKGDRPAREGGDFGARPREFGAPAPAPVTREFGASAPPRGTAKPGRRGGPSGPSDDGFGRKATPKGARGGGSGAGGAGGGRQGSYDDWDDD